MKFFLVMLFVLVSCTKKSVPAGTAATAGSSTLSSASPSATTPEQQAALAPSKIVLTRPENCEDIATDAKNILQGCGSDTECAVAGCAFSTCSFAFSNTINLDEFVTAFHQAHASCQDSCKEMSCGPATKKVKCIHEQCQVAS